MLKKFSCAVVVAVVSLVQTASADLNVTFDYTYDTGFFGAGTAARATLEAAGSFYGSLLQDSLTDITPGGTNSWDAVFFNPATGAQAQIHNMNVTANQLVVFVGTRNLGSSTLGVGGPGGSGASGTTSWLTNVGARGQGTLNDVRNDGANKTAIDFGPWGGSLSISSSATWNQDHTVAPSTGQNDLYSVVLHELGHLLGVGTADSWDNLVVGGQFVGPASVAEYGSTVPMEADGAHWLDGTMSQVFSNGVAQEALMDPSIIVGTRKIVTDLDVTGLSDMGWEVVPEPTSLALLSIGSIFLALVYRRRKRSA